MVLRRQGIAILAVFVAALLLACCGDDEPEGEEGPFVPNGLDVLFVIDNSRSMAGEHTALGHAFSSFTAVLDERVGVGKWRVAVVTTGMESMGCGPCPPDNENFYSCTNSTGETGRFQDRLGRNLGTIDEPEYEFTTDASCRVIDSDNAECFYDPAEQSGVVFPGINGCGYERGLAPVQLALSESLVSSYNANFLREDARLGVVVFSDEEDCGQVGDATENVQGISGKVCYYAAGGAGPDGSLSDPQEGRLYQLQAVAEVHAFLAGLKDDRAGGVRFAAVVGVADPADPGATQITYASSDSTADPEVVCSTPGCQGVYCEALPGTRYVALAQAFGLGQDGFVDTICQTDYSDTMAQLATFLTAE